MCTYSTERVALADSSGKGPDGWFPLETATVYYDHPVHAPDEHTVNIDFLNPGRGPGARVAVELSLASARALLAALAVTVERAAGHEAVPTRTTSWPSRQSRYIVDVSRTNTEGGAT